MSWTALVPLKPAGERKTRLANRLDPTARDALSLRLFRHVVSALGSLPEIGVIVVLSDVVPGDWRGGWIADRGRGLNREIEAARLTLAPNCLLVIHADLPLLRAEDITALLAKAESAGMAFAPDRHGTGTNALAIADGRQFVFRFGAGSCALHRAEGGVRCRTVFRAGLALDIDTPEDLDGAAAKGFRPD